MSQKARDGKITIEDLQGGTFTITNGGIYGIYAVNTYFKPTQSAVLGMHNIIQRPVARKWECRGQTSYVFSLVLRS